MGSRYLDIIGETLSYRVIFTVTGDPTTNFLEVRCGTGRQTSDCHE